MDYTVKPGDSLWSIAQEIFGDGSRWTELQSLNGLNGSTITAGQTLRTPSSEPVGASELDGDDGSGRLTGGLTDTSPAVNTKIAELMQDPTFAAFMRSANFDQSEIESNLAAVRDDYARQVARQMPMFQDQKEGAVLSQNRSAESRGMFRSGARLTGIAEAESDIDRNQNNYLSGVRDQQAEAERTAAQRIAQIRREQAEQEITARERLTMKDAEANLDY